MTREENFIDEVEIVIKQLEEKKVTTTRAVEALAKIRALYHEMQDSYEKDMDLEYPGYREFS